MGTEILKIEMQAVKSRLNAAETHTNQLSEVVGDVIQAVRDNDKHYHDAFAVKSPETEGVTLRDQFAMAALPSCMDQIWSRCLRNKTQVENVYEVAAAAAYEQADAMLTERARHSANRAEEQQAGPTDTPYSKSVSAAGDAEGWIDWNGGKCPVMPKVKVEVRLRNASIHTISAGFFSWEHAKKEDYSSPAEIVAYRVVRNVWENREENDIG